MLIPRTRFDILNIANKIFPVSAPATVADDYSLVALLRSLYLVNNDISQESTSVPDMLMVWYGVTDARDFVSEYGNTPSVVTIVQGCFDFAEIEAAEGWVSEFTVNGKAFPVNQYLCQFAETKIYINNKRQRLVAYVRNATDIWVQAFESILCRLLTWYYPNGVSEADQNFFKSIAVDNTALSQEEKVELFVSYVNNMTKHLDLRGAALKRRLGNIQNKFRDERIRTLEHNIERLMRDIERTRLTLDKCYEDFEEQNKSLKLLMSSSPEEDTSLCDFFVTHKQLNLVDIFASSLIFSVTDTLEFYDKEEFLDIFNNKGSFLHKFGNSRQQSIKAIKAIFGDNRGVFRVTATFNLAGFVLVSPRKSEMHEVNAMPNPHIYYYACSGGNDKYYAEYAAQGDWELGMEQAISATKNVNWGDIAVCKRMIEWIIRYRDVECIYIADDNLTPIERVKDNMRLVSFATFCDLLKQQEESNG